MREKRKAEFSFSLKIGGKISTKIYFFPSSEWEDAPKNGYQIMVDDNGFTAVVFGVVLGLHLLYILQHIICNNA